MRADDDMRAVAGEFERKARPMPREAPVTGAMRSEGRRHDDLFEQGRPEALTHMDQRSDEDMVSFVAIENQMRLETKLSKARENFFAAERL